MRNQKRIENTRGERKRGRDQSARSHNDSDCKQDRRHTSSVPVLAVPSPSRKTNVTLVALIGRLDDLRRSPPKHEFAEFRSRIPVARTLSLDHRELAWKPN